LEHEEKIRNYEEIEKKMRISLEKKKKL